MRICTITAITFTALAAARAQTHFNVSLDTTQELPQVGARTGSGMGNLKLSGTALSFNSIHFCGLSGNATSAHIFGRSVAGANAVGMYDLSGLTTTGATSGAISGALTLLDGVNGFSIPQQVEQLRSGLWHLCIRSEPFPGGEICGKIQPARTATILAVVRDRDGDPANGIQMNDADDILYLDRLRDALGHEVIVLGNSPAQVASPDDWRNHGAIDMVFISGSVRVADVAAAYRECPVSVVHSEAGISAPQSLADDSVGEAGVVTGQTELRIAMPGHPLAGGLCGTVGVYAGTGPGRMNYITANTHMATVATIPDDPAQAVICGYEKGVCMFDGFPAPARRVNLFLPETDTSNALNAGWALFDASIAWCLSTPALPHVTLVTPANGAVFVPAAGGISFRAASTMPIAPGDIKLTLNEFDESANLIITGESTSRDVTFGGLMPNRIYSGRISISNPLGTQTAYLDFDTFTESGAKILEVEDYNYDGGAWQVDPAPSGYGAGCLRIPGNAAAGYAGQTGVLNVDYFATLSDGVVGINCPYRPNDSIRTRETSDVVRNKYAAAMVRDYHVRHLTATNWLKYTSEIEPGSYHVYLRASRIAPSEIRLDKPGAPGASDIPQGTFSIPDTQNWGFSYVPLTDGHGTQVPVNLSGVSDSLRMTVLASHPSLYLNYLLLVSASVQPPPPVPVIENIRRNGNQIEFAFATETARRYTVQCAASPETPGNWKTLTTFGGTGVVHTVSDPVAEIPRRFYRVGVY